MKRSYLADLEYLNNVEKEALGKLINFADELTNKGIRHILVGSKARGDFKDTSDVDIIALHEEDMQFYIGLELMDMAKKLSEENNVTLSYMLFPEEIEYCDEEEAVRGYGPYSWIPRAIENDGIYIRKCKKK